VVGGGGILGQTHSEEGLGGETHGCEEHPRGFEVKGFAFAQTWSKAKRWKKERGMEDEAERPGERQRYVLDPRTERPIMALSLNAAAAPTGFSLTILHYHSHLTTPFPPP